MPLLYVATKNSGKALEINALLKDGGWNAVPFPHLPEIEETGETFEENAALKARFLSKLVSGPVIADDSGLAVDALKGAPGVYSARYAGKRGDDWANNKKLLADMEGIEERSCRFICVIALAQDGEIIKTFRGEAEGRLAEVPKGTGGFGYDPLFITDSGRTMAELSPEEKNAVSHRGKALKLLKEYMGK